MNARRWFLGLLMVGVVAAVGGFSVPVSVEPYGSCGLAGTWVTYLGDPTGPEDAGFYDEYVACGEATAVPRAVMLVGLWLIAGGTTGLLMQRSRNTDW
jgi:hypothetical protein